MSVENQDTNGEANKSVNKQKPEPPTKNELLDIHSVFYTIQGEGPSAGNPAVFIRLAGCNKQCPNCDTEYTKGRRTVSHRGVVDMIHTVCESVTGSRLLPSLVVITGGEPLRQQEALLSFIRYMDQIKTTENKELDTPYQGLRIEIETNGSISPDGNWELSLVTSCIYYIICPKVTNVTLANEPCHYAKYIGNSENLSPEDGLPLSVLGMPIVPARFDGIHPSDIFLQPEHTNCLLTNHKNLQACIQSCMQYGYRLSLQTHKIVNLP